ncbi:MAG: DUF881 domain-containing protein [Tissierellales bacterium]|jgi:uncharacterized protein YlxW (UPF0749 family)|nr:DUF881 domain-containing protein [Tissierellales bacterium]
MNKLKTNIALVIVCVVLGFALTIHFKNINDTLGDSKNPSIRSKELALELESLKKEREALQNEVLNLDAKVKKYESDASEESVYVNSLSKELLKYRILSGYEALTGEGIRITIDDPDRNVYYGDASSYIIDNYDHLLQLISALNITGAEGISINGQRYTSFTEIINIGGNHLNVNGKSISTPIIVEAIGNKENLYSAMNMKGGVLWNLEYAECKVDIIKDDNIQIPKYNKIREFEFATPINLGAN